MDPIDAGIAPEQDLFDLDELRSSDAAELAIVHPVTGKPTTWVWTLAGPGHPKSIAQSDKISKENLRLDRLRNQAQVNRKKWIEPEKSPEEQRRENAEFFADRVIGWTPVKLKGEDYSFSHDNCVKLLMDPAFGRVYMQLAEYFRADDSFTPGSATTS